MKAKQLIPQVSGNEIISTLFYLYLSLYLIGRSIFFITVRKEVVFSSEWYTSLATVFDIRFWSVITIVAGLLIFISIFAINEHGLVVLISGNLLAFMVYTVFSLTGANVGMSWFTMYMHAINATFHLILLVWGVLSLSKMIKMRNT